MQISEAFKSADARSIANVMQQWNFSLHVQQAGCRALKSLEAAPRVRASSKALWALSTLRVCAAVTQVRDTRLIVMCIMYMCYMYMYIMYL